MDYSLLLGIHTKSVAVKNSGALPEEFDDEG